MAQLTGKTALITGASYGIGRDLAALFAADGHHLVLTARSETQLNQVAEQLRAGHGVQVQVIAADLSRDDAPEKIFTALGGRGIDFLVNNAGFGTHGPFAESDLAEQLGMLHVNVVGLTHLTRLLLPGMLARRSGRIMNVSSLAAFLPGPLMAVYYATKAYVLSFSNALDAELAGSGVTVTALCPGPTTTEFQKRAGVENAPLFKRGMMTSRAVAELGYRAMMRGRRTIVTGPRNKFIAFSTRLLPRSFAAAITRKLNETRFAK